MPEGPYSGRLAFDPDTEFHLAEDGEPVVTEDGGRSWRYATPEDTSHNSRYHSGELHEVKTTATVEGELLAKHGTDHRDEVEAIMREQHPHHYEVLEDDAHFRGVRFDTDPIAATVTGHTEAYRDE